MDSDGWPRQGRDEALRVMRKAFAIHIAGDQHLASTINTGLTTGAMHLMPYVFHQYQIIFPEDGFLRHRKKPHCRSAQEYR